MLTKAIYLNGILLVFSYHLSYILLNYFLLSALCVCMQHIKHLLWASSVNVWLLLGLMCSVQTGGLVFLLAILYTVVVCVLCTYVQGIWYCFTAAKLGGCMCLCNALSPPFFWVVVCTYVMLCPHLFCFESFLWGVLTLGRHGGKPVYRTFFFAC